MKLSNQLTEVIDRQGRKKLAQVYMCECGADSFNIFVIDNAHQHVQCTECMTSYCDGKCAETLA